MSADLSCTVFGQPAVIEAEAEAVGAAVCRWLRDDHQCAEPRLSYCTGYARARVRAVRSGGDKAATVLELVKETPADIDQLLAPAEQQRLEELLLSCIDEVADPALAVHRRRIARLARRAATELLAETNPDASLAARVWVGLAAEALVLGVAIGEIVLGDPIAVSARREIADRERDLAWLNHGPRRRELANRVTVMLTAEKVMGVA